MNNNNAKLIAVVIMLLVVFAHLPIVDAQQEVLVYHVYYNGVLIIQVEVIPGNIVNVKVIPLYEIDTRSYYVISDLIVSPTKYRFVPGDIGVFAKEVNALVRRKDDSLILEYKVGKFMRTSVYDSGTGVLIREVNMYDDVNLSIALVAIIGSKLYYNTITVTVPLAIVILGLAIYSYIRREDIRIL